MQDGGTRGVTFHGENGSPQRKSGLGYGMQLLVVCLNLTGRTKEKVAEGKRIRADSFAIVDKLQVAQT